MFGGGALKVKEIFANEEIGEMRFSPRTRRTSEDFPANEEIEEMLGQMFPICPKAQSLGGRGPEIKEFFANEESEEMRFSPRTRRTRKEFHANEEMEEVLGHMFQSWPKGRS